MSATEIKQYLHQYIDKADLPFLNRIYNLTKEHANEKTNLSEEEKRAIDKGITAIEKGNFTAHNKVMSTLKKKYPDLKF